MFLRFVVAFGLVASACATGTVSENPASEDPVSATTTPPAGTTIVVDNQGGSLEGHTPRGFAGSGTGLFAGDELNPGFPADDGVQMWLTFELPARATAPPVAAVLASGVLQPRATPFADLGDFRAAPVRYAEFSRDLFDLEPIGAAIGCDRAEEMTLTCEVTDAVVEAIAAGDDRVQFRLRFDRRSDGDGEPDLARFFVVDPNTNQPGLFTLTLGY
jgi:hypothetical protein